MSIKKNRTVECITSGRRLVIEPHTFGFEEGEALLLHVWPATDGDNQRRKICALTLRRSDIQQLIDAATSIT